MSIAEISIRRRVSTIMVFIGLLGAGIYGYSQLGLGLFPDTNFPTVTISTTMVGTSPEEIENLVTRVVEQAASKVSGVQNITSTSMSGISTVSVEFDYDCDMEQAETDVRRSLEDYADMLPEDANSPSVGIIDPSSMPVMTIAFQSDQMSSFALRRLIEDEIDPLLNRVEGVGSTSISGGLVRQIQIEPDPARLSALGISLGRMQSAVAGRNYDQPAGELVGSGMRRSITAEISYHSLEEIGETVVGYAGDDPIPLSSIAEIIDGQEEVTNNVRVNGSDAVLVSVYKRSDANTVSTCTGLSQRLTEISETYGGILDIQTTMDQSDFIDESIDNLSLSGIIAFVVTILVIFAFLRSWKNSFLIGISIPVSLVFTFFAMYIAGIDLNIVSLAGLAISVGMLVDNSIVVIEAIHRHRQMGKDRTTAAIEGTQEVAAAITSSTLTTIAVFIPVVFVPGFTGQIFRDMALTVSFSLVISLCVAISLVPTLSALFTSLSTPLQKTMSFYDRLSRNSRAAYRKALLYCLDHGKAAIGATAGLFLLSVLLFLMGAIPTMLMPNMDRGDIDISFSMAQGVDLAQVDSVAAIMEEKVYEVIPDVDIESVTISTGSRSAGMFGSSSINQGSVNVTLVGSDRRGRSTSEYCSMLLQGFSSMPGVDVEIQMRGMTSDDAVAVTLMGDDMDALESAAGIVKARMEAVEGASGVYSSVEQRVPELAFVPDEARLALLGVSAQTILAEMQLGFQGKDVSTFTENGEEYDVLLRYPADYRMDRTGLAYTTVSGYPLLSLGSLVDRSDPQSIERENQVRTVTIATGTAPGFTSGQVGAAVEEAMEELDFGGLAWEMSGEYGDQSDTFKYLLIAITVAVILVYMVMAGQFENLREPFIIILTVPMALIGVVAITLFTGGSLSIMSLIGILMLAGIAVNDGIVLLDHANQLRRGGIPPREAIETAASVRLRPILMTTLTTVIGMVPVAVGIGQGSEMWVPLGTVVIGGLMSSMLLTILVEPCLFMATAGRSKS